MIWYIGFGHAVCAANLAEMDAIFVGEEAWVDGMKFRLLPDKTDEVTDSSNWVVRIGFPGAYQYRILGHPPIELHSKLGIKWIQEGGK